MLGQIYRRSQPFSILPRLDSLHRCLMAANLNH
jgi:hypothetical protein